MLIVPSGPKFVKAFRFHLLVGEEEHGDAVCHIVECQFLSADGWAPFSTIHLGNHYPRFRLVEATLSARQAKPRYIIYNLQVS